MTPDQIAEMREAARAVLRVHRGGDRQTLPTSERLAQTILQLADALEAERERCAGIARNSTVSGGDPVTDKVYNMACKYIAYAIERGDRP